MHVQQQQQQHSCSVAAASCREKCARGSSSTAFPFAMREKPRARVFASASAAVREYSVAGRRAR